jgi:two-component system cell cycle response regulator CpdR
MGAATQSKRRALLAEDDDAMRSLVAETLRGAGFEVQEVGDGRQMWIRTIQSAPYDLVISDLRLPIVDGLTVLEDLRERAPATPIILMSAFGDDVSRARAEKLRAVFLDKPFPIGELRAAVRRLCNGSTHRGSP